MTLSVRLYNAQSKMVWENGIRYVRSKLDSYWTNLNNK